ncbi:MAG: metallophosphoesterase [Xanthobacteraceae bacterium]|nr:metallophosphoesterase [Xanthobacteraceae bacterium]
MPKLAHISDIHFGPTFNIETWRKVRSQIKVFDPDILVASGDFVDHPNPFLMLAVKAELMDLCKECPSKPELFVVPGNHDVLHFGNFRAPLAPRWFETIFFNNTDRARTLLETQLKIPKLGLNEDCIALRARQKLGVLSRGAIWWNTVVQGCDGRLQSCQYKRHGSRWPIEVRFRKTAIACFDSNPSPWKRLLHFASGDIDADQITRLGNQPDPARCPGCTDKCGDTADSDTLLHVAILHHHALPIALPRESGTRRSKEGALESFLLLRNSGDFLHKLQSMGFDLVLHGHKHKPQCAQIELNGPHIKPYRITVLAGGSTAKEDELAEDNTLRLIETEPNGRLLIRTFESGIPNESENYNEPVLSLRQRAFRRAAERAKRSSAELYGRSRIDEVGNIFSTYRVTDLQASHEGPRITEMPYRLVMPAYGVAFNKYIHAEPAHQHKIQLFWRDGKGNKHALEDAPANREGGFCLICLNQPVEPGSGKGVTFGIESTAANTIAMSSWELQQRPAPANPATEFTNRYLSFPTRKFVFELQLPPMLDRTTPRLRCLRHRDYPNFPLTFEPNAPLPKVHEDFQLDETIQAAEMSSQSYDAATRTWRLEIDYPLAGYLYEFTWDVPKLAAAPPIQGQTRDYQKMLLDMADRLRRDEASPTDRKAEDLFKILANGLKEQLKSRNPSERQAVFLMVYDSEDQHLHPVLADAPHPTAGIEKFKVPLGGGLSGAAFIRRRVLVWREDPSSETLIAPVLLPGLKELQHGLALPIHYQQQQEGPDKGRLVLEPGAVIGAVTVASDAAGSKIVDYEGGDATAMAKSVEIQAIAQGAVTQILNLLSSRSQGG